MKKTKVLVISPTPTHPQNAGNRARIFDLLNLIKSLGHDVYFLHIKQTKGDENKMRELWGEHFISVDYHRESHKFSTLKRKFGGYFNEDLKYTYGIDEWYDPSLDNVVLDLHEKHNFDTVIVEYVFISKVLECFDSSVKKIIDTHDVFTNRHRHYLEQNQKPQWFSTSKKEEAKACNRADVVLAIQDKEKDFYSSICKSEVVTVGHLVPVQDKPGININSNKLLFVASDNPINVEGMKYFLDSIFPEVQNKVENVKVLLVGSVCKSIEDQPGLNKLGFVDDLKKTYEEADIVINPVLYNTGLSIKNLEALGFAKPLVTSKVGAEGLEEGIGKAYRIADSSEEFINHLVEILTDEKVRLSLAVGASDFVKNCNNTVSEEMKKILSK